MDNIGSILFVHQFIIKWGDLMNKKISDIEVKKRYDAYLQTNSYDKAGKLLGLGATAIANAVRRYTGICSCGKEVNKPFSDTMCLDCMIKNQERMKLRRETAKSKKICIHCGKNPVAFGCRSYCEECNDKRKTNYEIKKERKIKKGECILCKNKAVPDKNYCEFHLSKNKEVNRKYKLKNGYDGLRIKVLERDNYTCQCCGFKGNTDKIKGSKWLEIHHLYDRKNNMDNLITLCNKCHRAITHIYTNENINLIFNFIKQYYSEKL